MTEPTGAGGLPPVVAGGTEEGRARVRDILDNAEIVSTGEADPAPPDAAIPPKRGRGRPRKAAALPASVASGEVAADDGEAGAGGCDVAPPGADVEIDAAAVLRCVGIDLSDSGNGDRLREHFGRDLAVKRVADVASSQYVVWTGTHWNAASGADDAMRLAQRLGARIGAEAEVLDFAPEERAALDRAREPLGRVKSSWTDGDRAAIEAAGDAHKALAARRSARRRFAVSSRNANRLGAALKCAAPFLARDPGSFNAASHRVAVLGHTLEFSRRVERVREPDLECPDPEVERWIERDEVMASLTAIKGHRREHLITKLMPVAYDPAATCPRWDAFLEEFLPVAATRRCVHVFSGLGITGIDVQYVLFHHGSGANGKSVFLETLMRLAGPLGVGLPAASLVGESRASGHQASPDIARLEGARIVRVAELPTNEPVKEALVKLLTGGESMPVRDLFKGFVEFTPVFKAHMSGNGYPRIDGTDNGIWRRIVAVSWPVTVPVERRRTLSAVVEEFVRDEGSGILNWLVEGVLIYLREGFVIPSEVQADTQAYRDEMDPIGEFAKDCIRPSPGHQVQAKIMYESYTAWSVANAKRVLSETKFGLTMKQRLKWKKSSVVVYCDVELHDVPARPATDTGFPEPR